MKRQSDIALHAHRLEIYRVFLDFRFDLKAHVAQFSREKLWAYLAQVRLAEFYFSENIAMALSKTVDQALELQKFGDWIKDPQGADSVEIQQWKGKSREIFGVLDDALDILDTDIKTALRLMPR